MAKTVLITGTSSGYGKAIAEHFLAQNWNVVATMRQPNPELFEVNPGRLKILPLDVTKPASIENAIQNAVDSFGAIDVLVNNAGIGLASAFEATPDATIREIFETNTFGVMAMCRAIIPVMRKQGGGTIINVTSNAAIAPMMPLVSVYAASKCAIEGFTESLSNELELFNIRARLVEPGLAPTTNFAANGDPRMQGLIPADYRSFAQSFFAKMANYPTAYCSEVEVAEATHSAATESGRTIRFPAGADSKLTSALRWTTSEEHYLLKMRELFGARIET